MVSQWRRLAFVPVLVVLVLGWGVASAAAAEGDASQTASLTLESATPTSLTVTWDEVENANLYTIQWRLSTGTAFSGSYAATGGRHEITGLLPGREYLVRIEVADAGGVNFLRLRGTFRTPLTAPQELTVTEASATSLSLSWSRPEGWNPSGYTLRWRRPSDARFAGSQRLAGDATSGTVSGLTDQTQYTVTLFALNDLGRGGMEARVTAYAVDPLRLTLNSSREVCTANTLTELSWKIRGGLLPHRLFIGGKRIDLDTVQSLQVNCGPLALDEETGAPLAEQGKTFSALARDKRGVRAPAETMVELVAQGAPSLRASTAASGAVALNWSIESATGVTHWEYRQRRDEGQWGAWTKIAGSTGATTDHDVTGLTEDVRYSFRLRAASGSVAGPRSGTASAVAGLTPTVSSERETLRYDNLQSTEGATSAGSYSFLSDASDLTSGATTFAEVSAATALLVNNRGFRGRDYSSVLNTVQVGDQITWYLYSSCWHHFRVTAIHGDPSGAARKLLGIELVTKDRCGPPGAQQSNAAFFDGFKSNMARFQWDNPPNEPDVGPDGTRLLLYRQSVAGGHTYRLTAGGAPTSYIVDVPIGMRLHEGGGAIPSDGPFLVTYLDVVSGGFALIDPFTGDVFGSFIYAEGRFIRTTGDIKAKFDALIDSLRKAPLP